MWLNAEKSHRLENLVVLRQEMKKINRRDETAIFHEKRGLRSRRQKYRPLRCTMLLYPLERRRPWLFLYNVTGCRKCRGRRRGDSPRRNTRQIRAWSMAFLSQTTLKSHGILSKLTMTMQETLPRHGKESRLMSLESGDTQVYDIAASDVPGIKGHPSVSRLVYDRRWNVKES